MEIFSWPKKASLHLSYFGHYFCINTLLYLHVKHVDVFSCFVFIATAWFYSIKMSHCALIKVIASLWMWLVITGVCHPGKQSLDVALIRVCRFPAHQHSFASGWGALAESGFHFCHFSCALSSPHLVLCSWGRADEDPALAVLVSCLGSGSLSDLPGTAGPHCILTTWDIQFLSLYSDSK